MLFGKSYTKTLRDDVDVRLKLFPKIENSNKLTKPAGLQVLYTLKGRTEKKNKQIKGRTEAQACKVGDVLASEKKSFIRPVILVPDPLFSGLINYAVQTYFMELSINQVCFC